MNKYLSNFILSLPILLCFSCGHVNQHEDPSYGKKQKNSLGKINLDKKDRLSAFSNSGVKVENREVFRLNNSIQIKFKLGSKNLLEIDSKNFKIKNVSKQQIEHILRFCSSVGDFFNKGNNISSKVLLFF